MKTLDEHRRLHPSAPRARSPDLQMLAQEAVRIEALTRDPLWDHFLSYLEASLQKTERLMRDEALRLRDPHLVNDDAIRTCKANLTILETRAATVKEILLLPKFLKEHSALAKAQIADMAMGA